MLKDNWVFQKEHLEGSIAALGIAIETRTFKLLHKPMQLQPHQILAMSWIAEKENSLVKGGSVADNSGTGKVRPCYALEIDRSPH